MKTYDKIINALFKLSETMPAEHISYAELAKETGLHWTTVRRHIGNKQNIKSILSQTSNQILEGDHQKDTRSKILDAAEQMFAKHGYEQTTLDQVAESAGMTKGAIYWHFSSKSELFLALVERSLQQLSERLPHQSQIIFDYTNPIEALNRIFEHEFRTYLEEKKEKPMIFFEFISQRRDPNVSKKLNTVFSKLHNDTSKLLEQLQIKNQFTSNVSPESLSIILHALMNGVVLMSIVSPKSVPFETISSDLAKVLWNGIAPDQHHNAKKE